MNFQSEGAIMTLNKQQLDQLYRYCYALTTDRDNAYDLLQTAVRKYLEKPIRQSAATLPYIRKIIRNQFIDDARRAKCIAFESIENTETIALDTMTLDNILINEELADIAWSTLDAAERETMYLCSIEGYTAAEISAETNVPRGTVLSRIYRIRHKVMQVFDQQGISMGRNKAGEE